jgi:predicted transcriptional regulator
VFWPTVPRTTARRSALKALVDTFFGGSAEEAVAALLDESRDRLTPADLDRLAAQIEAARQEGR